jgi:electron transfer flavoprotein alpha/beta subunit
MAASRKRPITKTIADLGLDESRLSARLQTLDLYVPVSESDVEIVEGEDEADAGRKLALRLREEKII